MLLSRYPGVSTYQNGNLKEIIKNKIARTWFNPGGKGHERRGEVRRGDGGREDGREGREGRIESDR